MTDDADKLWRRYDDWWSALTPDDRAHVEKCCESGRTDERLCTLIREHNGPSKAAFEAGSKLSEGNSKYCAIPSALLEFLEAKRAHPPVS